MTIQACVKRLGLALICLAAMVGQVVAGQVEIVRTQFILRGDTWQVHTTLRHADTGWAHYADAWRVVTETGDVLATRTLFHPHVEEQPFTRSQGGIKIPADMHIVYVEAHDNEHGWSRQRVQVDLRQAKGERFTVQR